MNATMKIITAIAVVSTVVAVVEGVMLLQRPAVAPTVEQEIVVQAPAEDPPVPSTPIDLPIATVPGGKQTPTSPVDVARADAAVVAETGGAASGAEADADTGAAAPELNAELTPEQKRAQERELAKTKLRDAMVLQMEEAANQLLDRLQLDAAQYELAAEPIAKIRQAMVNLAVGQMDKGEQMMQKANQIRQDALLAGQTEEQIAALMKNEQVKMIRQMRDDMAVNIDNMANSLEGIRPFLNGTQFVALDSIQKELAQQKEMATKMMDSMSESTP